MLECAKDMRKALAILTFLTAGLWAAPVLAVSSPTVDLAAWVKANTDLVVSQVAIAGPENVYSLEPLGPALPTGEVLALVRTEAVSDDSRAAHRFQSWDAHILFDCRGGRVRVLRSTSYLERDRQGAAQIDERGDAWFSPQPEAPAATLMAAACDASFHWPLRPRPAVAAPSPAEPAPLVQTTVATATPPAAPGQPKRAAEKAITLAAVEPGPKIE
jgi:pyruvate/2-oxoglutarate dehydrogenase complex dihydrolipoamide acyltransferase (E2) component